MPCLCIGRIRRRLLSARDKRAISRRNSRVIFGSHRAPTSTGLGSLHSRGSLLFPLIVFAPCSTFPGIASLHSVYHSSTITSTAARRAFTKRDPFDERQLRGLMGYDLRSRQKALAALAAHLRPVRVHGPTVRTLDHLGLTPLECERCRSSPYIFSRRGIGTSSRPPQSQPTFPCAVLVQTRPCNSTGSQARTRRKPAWAGKGAAAGQAAMQPAVSPTLALGLCRLDRRHDFR